MCEIVTHRNYYPVQSPGWLHLKRCTCSFSLCIWRRALVFKWQKETAPPTLVSKDKGRNKGMKVRQGTEASARKRHSRTGSAQFINSPRGRMQVIFQSESMLIWGKPAQSVLEQRRKIPAVQLVHRESDLTEKSSHEIFTVLFIHSTKMYCRV